MKPKRTAILLLVTLLTIAAFGVNSFAATCSANALNCSKSCSVTAFSVNCNATADTVTCSGYDANGVLVELIFRRCTTTTVPPCYGYCGPGPFIQMP